MPRTRQRNRGSRSECCLFTKPFDAPEMIEIRRTADLHEVRLNKLIKNHAAVIRAVASDRRNNENTLARIKRDHARNLTMADRASMRVAVDEAS